MLTFVGLGLYDERSLTIEARDALQAADRVFAEWYTSRLVGADISTLERAHGLDVEVRDRDGVERDPEPILAAAETSDVAFVTAGDTMISTTHTDLRLRAIDRGIHTQVVHGVTVQSAASSLTGLQNYRFGKAVTLPFPYAHGDGDVPGSVVETVEANRDRGLHTLVYLDIKVGTGPRGPDPDHEEYMRASHAAELLTEPLADQIGVVVARAGAPDPVVEADRLSALAARDFGDPLHVLVLPGDLHHVEAEALVGLADAPPSLVADEE